MRHSHRLIRNALANTMGQGARLVAGFVLPPFVVARVGRDGYGVVVMLASVLQFVALVQLGTPQAMNRFVSRELALDRRERLGRVLSSGLWLLVAAGGVAAVLVALVLVAPDLVLAAPDGMSRATLRWLVVTMGLVAVLSIPLSVGHVAFYATERFPLLNGLQIAGTLGRIVLVVALLAAFPASVLAYAAGDAAAALATAVATCVVGVRLLPGTRWGPGAADVATARGIAGYGAEVFANTLVFLLFLQADYYLIGKSLGPEAVTLFYLAAIWGLLMRSVIGSAVSVVLPTAANREAVGDREALVALLVRSTKYALLAGLVPVAFLCAFRERIVAAWMGEGYETTAALMLPLLVADLLTLGTAGANDVFTGLGRVRVFTWTSLAAGAVNVAVVLFLLGVLGLGLPAVAWTYFAVFVVRSAIVLPWWTSRELGLAPWRLYRDAYVSPALVALVALPVSWLVARWVPDAGWPSILLAAAICAVPCAPAIWLVGLDAWDRQVLSSLVRGAPGRTADAGRSEP
jgi:membrane protein EpsK